MPYVQNSRVGSCRWVDPPYELQEYEKFIDTQPKTDTPTAPDLNALVQSMNNRLTEVERIISTL